MKNTLDDDLKVLVDQLSESRLALNMTRAQLSEKSGVHQNSIFRIEKRKTTPDIITLGKLFNALGYNIKIGVEPLFELERRK